MKKSMSFYDLVAWIAENRGQIEGCWIDNVYTVSGTGGFDLRLRCKDGLKDLVLEPGKYVVLAKVSRPLVTDNKAQQFRSLVRDKAVKTLSTLGRERVMSLTLNDGYQIIAEFLPRGKIVITSPDGKILFVNETMSAKDRTLRPGVTYVPPPQPTLTEDEIKKALAKGDLRRLLGVPQEVVDALNIKVATPEDLERAKAMVNELLSKLERGEVVPCLRNGIIAPFAFPGCEKYNGTFNDLVEQFFLKAEEEEREKRAKEKLEEEKEKLLGVINSVKSSIEENRRKADELRKAAKKILEEYTHYEQLLKGRKGKIKVSVDGTEVELDASLGLNKSVGLIFEQAKELESKAKRAEEKLSELEKELAELEEKIREAVAESKVSLRKKEWYERYRWSFTRNGLLIISGIDADQNESIVKKYLNPNDLFFHADIHGAAATVLKCDREPTEDDIFDAAVIAAAYSKAWKAGMGGIEVFWVKGDQVSKSPPSGQYLPKGSFMIYGKKNYVKVSLELFACFERQGEGYRPFVGSEASVRQRCEKYVKLVPGDDDPGEVAEKIIKVLQRQMNVQGLRGLKKDLERLIPGRSKVVPVSQ